MVDEIVVFIIPYISDVDNLSWDGDGMGPRDGG
jgi:hypothetical protein